MRTFPLPLLATTLLLSAAAQAQSSKDKDTPSAPDRVIIERGARGGARVFFNEASSPRSMIGVSTSSSGPRDTLGLLVTSVTPNGPAEKAGIVEGNRIAAINGVNLRLAAADAGQSDMQGITARRLTRELAKVEPGKEVELRIYADGQFKTVRLKTVPRDSLVQTRFNFSSSDDRAVLGFQLSATGSRRDTLGVLIGSLQEDGPAEKAGLIEGDRIVSVNGTDLRISREDAGDDFVSSTMVSRFQRVMRGVKPGDKVQLRVWSGGQAKNVTITAAKSSEIYKENSRFRMIGPMTWGIEGADIAPMPPLPPMPAIAPRIRINSMEMDDDDDLVDDVDLDATVQGALESARAADAAAARRAKVSARAMVSKVASTAAVAPVTAAVWAAADAANARAEAEVLASGRIQIPGLSLAPVSRELAEYLGKGSEKGYLVLEANGEWGALHAGDVIISVDGTAIRDACMTADEGHDFVVLRKGQKVSLHM